jgi:hypothetical protein
MGANIQFTVEADDPLPVQLSSFSAESDHGCVLLRWVTASEIDHAGFELLRSSQQTDGYSSISDYRNNPDLMGQGNSSVKHDYLYIDRDVLVGESYWYYLVDVDLKGQRTFHGPLPVSVTNDKELNQLSSNNPQELRLYPNFPNPFNQKTMINYELRITNYVDLSIYNLSGEKVAMLFSESQAAGFHQVAWDGKSDAGKAVSSGIYFLVLKTRDQLRTGKMILMR